MTLRNVLLVVTDLERAVAFYKDLFGLQVIVSQEGNAMMSEGLVLQEASIWKESIGKELYAKNHMTELYFEEWDIENFVKKLEASEYEIEYVTELIEFNWGQKMVRFYDLDGNLIEVRTPVKQ